MAPVGSLVIVRELDAEGILHAAKLMNKSKFFRIFHLPGRLL